MVTEGRKTNNKKWSVRGSNSRPPRYQHGTLPTELTDQLQQLRYKFHHLCIDYSFNGHRRKGKKNKKWSVRGSNSRPPHYQHGVLPTELTDQLLQDYKFTSFSHTWPAGASSPIHGSSLPRVPEQPYTEFSGLLWHSPTVDNTLILVKQVSLTNEP